MPHACDTQALTPKPWHPSPDTATAVRRARPTEQVFMNRWRNEYGYDGRIDAMYPIEVGVRMGPNEHYLDYTGASVYAQVRII